jgi:hypothetical protein
VEPPFDAALYAWERGLFAEHLLAKRFGTKACRRRPRANWSKWRTAGHRAAGGGHRDFQSSNVCSEARR